MKLLFIKEEGKRLDAILFLYINKSQEMRISGGKPCLS
jgi:hypothetical protein